MRYAEALEPCTAPVRVPDGWLSDQQVEVLWSRDRRALLDCSDKVETLSGRKQRKGFLENSLLNL
jgi:hypothetical protein